MSDTQQLTANKLRITIDVLSCPPDKAPGIFIRTFIEILLRQEHLPCKIMLLGNDYIEKALELSEKFGELRRLNRELIHLNGMGFCLKYINIQNRGLEKIVVQGETRILIFNNIEQFSILKGTFFDKQRLRQFLKIRYKYKFRIILNGNTIECHSMDRF